MLHWPQALCLPETQYQGWLMEELVVLVQDSKTLVLLLIAFSGAGDSELRLETVVPCFFHTIYSRLSELHTAGEDSSVYGASGFLRR